MACARADTSNQAAVADVEVAEKEQQAYEKVTDGTLMRTFLLERDWSVPHFTFKFCLRPQISLLQVYVVFAMNFLTWFGSDTYDFLFKIRLSEVLVCLQQATMIAPVVGFMGFTPGWVMLPLLGASAVLVFMTDCIMTNRSIGIGIFAVGVITIASVMSCKGKMSKPRRRYFCAIVSWALFLQLCTFVFMKYALMAVVQAIVNISNEFVGGLFFPMFGVIYGASALQSFVPVNRRMMPVGAPMVCSYSQIFGIRCFATTMKIAGFIPKAGISDTLVVISLAGSFLTNFLSGVSERTFFAQRVKHALAKRCSSNPAPICIKPEMDSYVRAKVTVSRAVIPYFWVALAMGLPAKGWWTTSPFVWAGPAVYLLSEIMAELVIIVLHRVYCPIEGETFLGTRERLTKPFMHWPALQADEGAAYKRAAAAAKGERVEELEQIAKEDEERKVLAFPPHSRWSANLIFPDEILAGLYAFGCNIHMVCLVFVLRYDHCRIWTASGAVHEKYGSCVGM